MDSGKTESLFHEARALASPAEQRVFLDEACGDDAAARERVKALLRADAGAGGFLRTASVDDASGGTTTPDGLIERVGSVIGSYTLVGELGEGGFGIVFLAEQTEPLSRQVALKVVKAGMDTRQVLARFEAERQALALMDHPNIAGVYDAGTTAAGRPYFVMQLVDGVPINTYADQHSLDIRSRLQLFRKVCSAVQHAHQKGVIHRDLKPSNILVTEVDGAATPKVIDFGIAKATSRDDGQPTMTRDDQFIGTPQYMSPEQSGMIGIDVDTRTDVYALGVVLYELLTGTTPLDPESLRSASVAEMHRLINEADTPRPSTRVAQLVTLGRVAAQRRLEPRALPPLLRRDLDWIVLKALQKDRALRYGAVGELAEDVRRYLDDEPVTAGRPTAGYRLRKFVQRNKTGVAAGLALATVLVVGTVGTTIGLVWALTTKKQLAETNIALDQIVQFQSSRLSEIDPARMGTGMRSELIARGRQTLERSDLEPAQVEELLEQYDELLATTNFTTLALNTLEDNVFNETLAAIDEQFDDQPVVQAQLLHTMGVTLNDLGLQEPALEPLTRALEIRREHLGEDDPETLDSTAVLAILLGGLGRAEEAGLHYERALEGRRRVLGLDHPRTLDSINSMGSQARRQGDLAQAEKYFREAVEGCRRVHGDDHEDTLSTVNNLAAVLQMQGKLDEADPLYRSSRESVMRLLGDDHPKAFVAQYNIGQLELARGNLDEAERLHREALEGLSNQLGDEHPHTIVVLNGLGTVMYEQGRMEEAASFIRRSWEGHRRLYGDYHPQTVMSLANLGGTLRELQQLDEAETLGAQALRTGRLVFPEGHWVIAGLMSQHARTLGTMGRFQEAADEARQAHAMLVATVGDQHPYTVDCVQLLVEVYTAWDEDEPGQGYEAQAREWSER